MTRFWLFEQYRWLAQHLDKFFLVRSGRRFLWYSTTCKRACLCSSLEDLLMNWVMRWMPLSARSLVTGRLVAKAENFLYSENTGHIVHGIWSQSWGPSKPNMLNMSQELGVTREARWGLASTWLLQSITGKSGLPIGIGILGILWRVLASSSVSSAPRWESARARITS